MAEERDRILDIVVEILETEGYEAVQLREVARRAKTSLATIYKRYSTRDELILAALDSWMAENRYSGLAGQVREPGETLYEALMRLFRTIFEPWEKHPDMLRAYSRARAAPRRVLFTPHNTYPPSPAAAIAVSIAGVLPSSVPTCSGRSVSASAISAAACRDASSRCSRQVHAWSPNRTAVVDSSRRSRSSC